MLQHTRGSFEATQIAPPAERPDRRESHLRGILLMCGAVVGFAGIDTSAKFLNLTFDPLQTIWVRYAVSFAFVFAVLNPWSTPGVARSSRPGLQILRSLLLLATTAFNFGALIYLQLAQTSSINFAAPLIVALLAGPLLGERVGARQLAVIGAGLFGVLVVVRPFGGNMHFAMLLSLGATFANVFYIVLTRQLASHDSSKTTMFYSSLVGVVLLTPVVPFVWVWPATATQWLVMGTLGFMAAFGHWLLIVAHRHAPASVLAPFMYTQLIWMIALGFFVFGDVPDAFTLAGGGIIVASGLYLLASKRRDHSKRAAG